MMAKQTAEQTPAVEPKAIEGLTEGRMVHYVMNNKVHRPAVIVQVWNVETGCSNLRVFVDGSNDGYSDDVVGRATSILYSEDKEPGTWHFIERA